MPSHTTVQCYLNNATAGHGRNTNNDPTLRAWHVDEHGEIFRSCHAGPCVLISVLCDHNDIRKGICCCVCQLVKSKIAGSCHATTSCYNTYFQMSENMATQMSFAGKLNDAITLCVEDEKPTPSTICCIGKYRSRSDLCLAMGAIPTVAED